MAVEISPTVDLFVVDDDQSVRDALSALFTLGGYRVTGFADGISFLAAAHAHAPPSCILLDVRMPGRSGLDILRELNAEQYGAPILLMSGQGDIPMAVDAIRHGALDFIEKPFDASVVVGRVGEAIDGWRRRAEAGGGLELLRFPGNDLLTPREREVLSQIANGASNKEAGRKLGISPRTIEVHRGRIMEKLGARNAADLVRIVLSEKRIA